VNRYSVNEPLTMSLMVLYWNTVVLKLSESRVCDG